MNKIISVTRNTTYFITLAFLAFTLCRCNLAKDSAKVAPEDVAAAEVAVVATEVAMPSSATAAQSSSTHIAALPTPALLNILSYTDAATCVATYQLSRSYLEGVDLWGSALARDQLLIPKVLGNNFVATKAWKKLDVEVPALPELSPALIAEVKRLHQLQQQPLLVLDLGKSIAELEALCKAQGLSVFKADGDDEKLRAEAVYMEVDIDCQRWLVLPSSDHGVLPGSRNKTYENQIQYMHQHYPMYEVGKARVLIHVVMLKYIQDGTLLFPRTPCTYARGADHYLHEGKWEKKAIIFISTHGSDDGGKLNLAPAAGYPPPSAITFIHPHHSIGMFGYLLDLA